MVQHLVNQLQFKWSPHDLRRTFVTISQRTLKDLATLKRMANHSVGGDVTMKHYLRLSVEDLREPMQQVEDAFDGLYKERPTSITASQAVELLDSGLGISRQSVYSLAKTGTT